MKGKALKFSDALHLSWSNISQHKSRSVIIVLTISVLFGVVMAFNFMLEGLGETTFDAAMQASDGKIYIVTGYDSPLDTGKDGFYRDGELKDMYEEIRALAEQHHGQIIGRYLQYNIGNSRWIVNKELAERFGNLDLSKLEGHQVPYVSPRMEPEDFDKSLKNPDGTRDKSLVKVGTYPSLAPGKPTLPGFNPLNLLLSRMGGGYPTNPLIVDDGSDRITEYLQNIINQYGYERNLTPYLDQDVIMFDNYDDAVAYYWNVAYGNERLPKYIEVSGSEKYAMLSSEQFSDVIGAELITRNTRNTLIFIEIFLIIVAVVIATLTFAHIIDQDATTIALYRSLGASTGNIYLVYFLYLLEMCVLAVLACIVMAMVLAGLLWLFNADALAKRLQEFYMLSSTPKVVLFGFDSLFYGIVGSIMIIAPITLLLTLHNFSNQHIAKKLKED